MDTKNKALQETVYPEQFGEKEIKYFEILASKVSAKEIEILRSEKKRKGYTAYEDALICLAPNLKISPKELASVFRGNPYCSERTWEAIDQRRRILDMTGSLKKLYRKVMKHIEGGVMSSSSKKTDTAEIYAGKTLSSCKNKKVTDKKAPDDGQGILFAQDSAEAAKEDATIDLQPEKTQEDQEERENTIAQDSDSSFYTYPDRFAEEDINRLENIRVGRNISRIPAAVTGRNTKNSYAEYDKDFLLTCIEREYGFNDVSDFFDKNPYLAQRNREGLRFQFYKYKRMRETVEFSDYMEKEYAKAKVPEEKRLPKDCDCGVEIDLDPIIPEVNSPEVNEADMAIAGHMFENKNMGAVLFSGAYTYKRMKDHTDLYKRFKQKNRQVDSNKPKMLFVADVARYLNMSNEAATDYVDSMSAVGLPFKREGREVLLIEPDSILGGNMPNFKLDIPSLDIGGGVKCTPIGLISDTHYGAEGCAEDLVRRYYRIAYERFHVRCFLHAGDLVDGNGVYPGQPFEQNRIGFDQQLRMAAELYPYYPDVMTYAIAGNHDESYIKNAGANIINALHLRRKDIVPLGIYQALVSVNGFHINLHHANGSCGALLPESKLNSIAQRKQYIVDNYGFNVDRLDLVVVGHYHQRGFLTDRSKYLVDTLSFGGTFEKPSSFVKRSFDMTNILSGYVAHLYRFPNGKKRIMLTEIPFDISKEEGHSQPKTVDLPFCDSVYGEVYANAS